MSFLDMLMGNNSKLASKDIAQDMSKDSKFAVTSLAGAAAEAVDPQLRQMVGDQLDKAIGEHFQLSDMLIRKGWYPAYDDPTEQIRKEYEKAKKFS